MLWRPVEEKLWTHRDLVEKAFSIHDLFDAHEALDNWAANKAAVRRWEEMMREK